jgi:hypothetical protein
MEIVNQELADLPTGVSLRPGEITVQFSTTVEALEKLLAIAMAAGNDLDGFERLIQKGASRTGHGDRQRPGKV